MRPKINIITLAVNDLEKSIVFYKDGLGLPMEEFVEGADHIIFGMEGDLSLVLYLRTELEEFNQSNSVEKSSKVILSHAAESKEEVDSILKTATEFGGSLLPNQPKEYDWGYSGYFKDPDGHIWEIVYFTLSE
ncbi:VOC family protein [Cytobacillus kochii]|uniref:VOC family protein n=1 Tax=Cytobacillus kochii TaxID=859143 RepID=UPI002780517E|nr:VOC family protein [Cytobacillus kochii]MDQ0185701.1 putative lactoylglutathione lyase [Cytobacillus kochii]